MKVKLINAPIAHDYAHELLRARGVEDVEAFLNPTSSALQTWRDLKNVDAGVDLIASLAADARVALIVDSDVDGFTSAAIVYQYLKRLYPELAIQYYLHDGKAHGLEEHWEYIRDGAYDLVIVPDAGSNDAEYAKQISAPILVIDHHIADVVPSINMCVINNQSSSTYKNKGLSGAGMAYQFCRALDEKFNHHWAEDYIDLAATGVCGDMMPAIELENQYLWKTGFANIQNGMLRALVDKQSFSMGGDVNPTTVAFYIVPLINAMIRVGTYEEKERLFWAFVDSDRMVPCNKRGAKGTFEKVSIESARECTNARAHQNKAKDTAIERIKQKIYKNGWLDNQILFVQLDDDDDFPAELNGLVATQLVSEFRKPTIVARLNEAGYLRGSIRGVGNSELGSFKGFLDSTGLFQYVQGHAQAAGCSLPETSLNKLHEIANTKLKKYNFGEEYYEVNFKRYGNASDLAVLIMDIGQYADCWGQMNEEPKIYVESLNLTQNNISIIGTKKDTVRIEKDGVTYLKFHAEDLIQELNMFKNVQISVVGRANINEWGGRCTPQLLIDAYEVSDGDLSF